MNTGVMLTAVAGPASNLVLALLMSAVMAMIGHVSPDLLTPALPVLSAFIVMNVLLAFFNLLPIPPLDGSRVVDSVLPGSLRPLWDALEQYSAFALLAVIVLPRLSGIDLFAWPQQWAMHLVKIAVG
jgi:Zn-dependent protease